MSPIETISRSVAAGALIGVVAHPISAVVMMVTSTLGSIVWGDIGLQLELSSIGQFFSGVAFLLFWWCLIAVLWVGWFTMLIGGVAGGLFGISRRLVVGRRELYIVPDSTPTGRWTSLFETEIDEPTRSMKEYESRTLAATGISIVSVCLLSAISLTFNSQWNETRFAGDHVEIIKKSPDSVPDKLTVEPF